MFQERNQSGLARQPERVVLIATDHHLGNFMMMLPTINALSSHFGSGFEVMADERYADLLGLMPSPARAIRYPSQAGKRRGLRKNLRPGWLALSLRLRRFELAIDLVGNQRSGFLTFCTRARRRVGFDSARASWSYSEKIVQDPIEHISGKYAQMMRVIGKPPGSSPLRLRPLPSSRNQIETILQAAFPGWTGPLAVLHPGAGKAWRCWPAERFARVADELAGSGFRICLIGAGELDLMRSVRAGMAHPEAAGFFSLSLLELLSLFERAAILVSNEGGPTHLAAATAVPIVTIFGPARESRWRPLRRENLILLRGAECDPRCRAQQCYGQLRCLNSLAPDQVMKAVRSLLGQFTGPLE